MHSEKSSPQPGQASGFSGYGGIEDPAVYIHAVYGLGWSVAQDVSIPGVLPFPQSELEPGANNCTLTSITRVMKYYHDTQGLSDIPDSIQDIYRVVREVGVEHGYDPHKQGLFRDLFVYTAWDIDNMVRDDWKRFDMPKGKSSNHYLFKLDWMRAEVDAGRPLLLNIVSGDYPGHTVSVYGYQIHTQNGKPDIPLVRIYDGWSGNTRYIDWKRFGWTLASVTTVKKPQ